MSNFGAELRRIRERSGVSLAQISGDSKVSVRHLEALEAERFDQLPGGILTRGIVRSYLRCLGLDEAEWMPRFLDSYLVDDRTGASDDSWRTYAQAVTGQKPSAAGTDEVRFRWWGAVLLLLLAGAMAFAVWHFATRHVTRGSVPETSSQLAIPPIQKQGGAGSPATLLA